MDTKTATIGQAANQCIDQMESEKQSQCKRCACGREITPITFPVAGGIFKPWAGRIIWPQACRTCEAESKREGLKAMYHKNRMAGVLVWKYAIAEVVPPRYRAARMGHLPEAVQSILTDLPSWRGLYLTGPVGTGKTYTMCAFARYMILNKRQVKRIRYDTLCRMMRATYGGVGKQTDTDILQPLIDAQRLIIEDVGTAVENGKLESDFSIRTLLEVLDVRNEYLRPTYITSNLSFTDLEASFGQRVTSRIKQHCELIAYKGKDKRE